MTMPNIIMTRIDERLIHGQGQLWVKYLGCNTVIPNHSYLSQLDVTYKTPDLMSHFLPPHEVSFTFCCSSIVFPR
ncbi:PTS sugar transporter subunit IIB [Streptococcus pneumoniae]|uniref:PTS sugar transporter subunit IIB n=1 Tax=Streptococcus pneumoniae TaxID=1313 RepID=UPI0010EDD2EC|nr:ABC transporter membrane protein [Streptococcus pneumoniae]